MRLTIEFGNATIFNPNVDFIEYHENPFKEGQFILRLQIDKGQAFYEWFDSEEDCIKRKCEIINLILPTEKTGDKNENVDC